MTAYNREKYIGEAIESVLASTYCNFELIIVDDGSVDSTVQISTAYAKNDRRIKVFVNEKNLGDYQNRNKAASYAKGKYIKYLDSDDVLYPYGLAMMTACMEKFPKAGFGLSAKGDIKAPNPICISPHQTYLEHFFYGFGHFGRAPGSSIIKKAAFDEMQGFSGLRQVGDTEFWLKIACYFPMVKIPLDMYWSRAHTDTEKNVHSVKVKDQMRLAVIENTFKKEKVPLSEKEKQKILFAFKNPLLNRILSKVSKEFQKKQ